MPTTDRRKPSPDSGTLRESENDGTAEKERKELSGLSFSVTLSVN